MGQIVFPWLMRPIHRGRLPRVPRGCRGRPGGPGGGGEGPLRARVADLHPAHPHHHQQAIRGDRQPGEHCTTRIRLNVSKLYLTLCLPGVLLRSVPGVEAEAGGQQEQGSEAGV